MDKEMITFGDIEVEKRKFHRYKNTIFLNDVKTDDILGGDYMIPTCRDEISTRPAETDFTTRLHVEIKFRPGKTGQFSTCYLIILNIICMHFLWIFFFFFL